MIYPWNTGIKRSDFFKKNPKQVYREISPILVNGSYSKDHVFRIPACVYNAAIFLCWIIFMVSILLSLTHTICWIGTDVNFPTNIFLKRECQCNGGHYCQLDKSKWIVCIICCGRGVDADVNSPCLTSWAWCPVFDVLRCGFDVLLHAAKEEGEASLRRMVSPDNLKIWDSQLQPWGQFMQTCTYGQAVWGKVSHRLTSWCTLLNPNLSNHDNAAESSALFPSNFTS